MKDTYTVEDIQRQWDRDEAFEQKIMERYPELFNTDAAGSILPADCGIGCPEEWEQIIDDLCGSIVSYTKNTRLCITNPHKKGRIFFYRHIWKPLWLPIYNGLHKIIDPYKPFRPRDVAFRPIPKDVEAKVKKSFRYKLDQKLKNLQYGVLCVKDMYIRISPPAVKIVQVKSKFGGLRFYIDGGDDYVRGMIRLAEYLCEQKNKLNGKRSAY